MNEDLDEFEHAARAALSWAEESVGFRTVSPEAMISLCTRVLDLVAEARLARSFFDACENLSRGDEEYWRRERLYRAFLAAKGGGT